MKKILFLFLIVSLIGCSSSKEKKAKALIKEYMMENLKDPSSYEPVSFSDLDSIFFPYIDTEGGSQLWELGSVTGKIYEKAHQFELDAIIAKTIQETKILEDSAKFYKAKSEEYQKLYEKNEASYTGEFIGWILDHRYRAKNGMGALDFAEETFYFNKDVTEIVTPYGIRRY